MSVPPPTHTYTQTHKNAAPILKRIVSTLLESWKKITLAMQGTECTPESLTCPECGVNEGQGSLKFPQFIKIYRKSGENERNSYLRQFIAGKGEVLFLSVN